MNDSPIDAIELKKSFSDLAESLRHYYAELVGQGFSKREAFSIILAYQRDILRGSSSA